MIREKARFTESEREIRREEKRGGGGGREEGEKETRTETREREESTKGANINATLQTADVAPITNLILPPLSLPLVLSLLSSPQTEKEGETRGDICRIQTYHIRVAFTASSSPSLSLFLSFSFIFSVSPFHRLSHPSGDDIGYIYVWKRKG